MRTLLVLCASSSLYITTSAIAQEAIAQEAPLDTGPSRTVESVEDQRTAEEHLARGLELYGLKHYLEAVAEFRAGYAISDDAQLLYALAQSLRLAGQCEEAVRHYRRFLDSEPSPTQAAAARSNLERCREPASSASAERPLNPAPKPAEAPPSPPSETKPPRPADGRASQADQDRIPEATRASSSAPPSTNTTIPWYADPLGASLTGGGILGLGAGVALLMVGRSEKTEAQRLEQGATRGTYEDHADNLDKGEEGSIAGGVLSAVGLTAIVLGSLRYHVVASRRSVDVAVTVLPSGATATLGGTL